jgi:hypothetical protein
MDETEVVQRTSSEDAAMVRFGVAEKQMSTTPNNIRVPDRQSPLARAGAVRRLALTAALATAIALMLPASAVAEFTTPALVSGTESRQFEDAEAPALARDGDYVAFQGAVAGVSGVWRRNLETGAVEPVATAYDAGAPGLSAPTAVVAAGDAKAPSISFDGRYIAFTTTADLEPEHLNHAGEPEGEPAADKGCPEVYVRDMEVPASEAGAYTLAAAVGESGAGILFEGKCGELGGAQAAPGVALSANGRSVAFTVLTRSNLTRGAGCAPSTPLAQCPPETPSSEVAVRNLETGTTTVVSVTPDGQPTPGGGAFPSEETETYQLRAGSTQLGDQITASTAAISGDGSTVAWLGTDVPAQVPGSQEIEAHFRASSEVEPLWRRIADGASASTRRLLAGAGLEFFFNKAELLEAIKGGSFVAVFSGQVFIPPVLSEDGETVAVISNAPRPAQVPSLEDAEHEGGENPPQSDAYAVRVGDDPAIQPQVIPLTETPNYDNLETASEGYLKDIAISPDGTHIAFDCERSQLTTPSLSVISPPSLFRSDQTYVANLELGTLQRATVTYDGEEPVGGDPGLLSFSGQGGLLAFASGAMNLFYGDAVNASEVYLSEEVSSSAQPAPEHLSAVPNEAPPQQEWKLNATATAARDGSVLVDVQVPGAGRLAVQAGAQLPATADAAVTKRFRTTGAKPTRRSSAGKERARSASKSVRLITRIIAKAAMNTATATRLQLRLRAASAYRATIAGRHGLYATLELSFASNGKPTLTEQIPVTFRSLVGGKSAKSRSKSTRKKRRASK